MEYFYENSKIYKIRCNSTGRIYVGSCLRGDLNKRLGKHKCSYSAYLQGNGSYMTSFEILKNENYEIIEIEHFPCNDKQDLRIKEGQYILLFQKFGFPIVNKKVPGRTMKETYKAYNERNKEKRKEYREANKEKIKKKVKEYQEANKEKMKEYQEANKEKIKEYAKKYREANKEKMKENAKKYQDANRDKINGYAKKYYQKNRELINEKNKKYLSKKVQCECGDIMSRSSLSRHKKRPIHFENLNKKNN